jgi:hypothetical protein
MNKFLIPFVLLNIILVYLLTVEVGPIIDDSCKEPLPKDFYGTMRDWHCIINNRKRFVFYAYYNLFTRCYVTKDNKG